MVEEKEEFELIPISPIRKLEKRIEELESGRPSIDVKEFLKEMIDIIKMNQELINKLTAANEMLRIEISKLPAKIDDIVKSLGELIGYIKAAAVAEVPGAGVPFSGQQTELLTGKIDQLVEGNKRMLEISQAMVSALEEINKRLKRPTPTLPARRLPPRFIPPPAEVGK